MPARSDMDGDARAGKTFLDLFLDFIGKGMRIRDGHISGNEQVKVNETRQSATPRSQLVYATNTTRRKTDDFIAQPLLLLRWQAAVKQVAGRMMREVPRSA